MFGKATNTSYPQATWEVCSDNHSITIAQSMSLLPSSSEVALPLGEAGEIGSFVFTVE